MNKFIKKAIATIMVLSSVFAVTSCGKQPTEIVEDTSLERYFTPVVSVSKTGLATWWDLENAGEYIYKINDGKEVKTTEKSVQLSLNDEIVVKCVGNNTTRRSSRWSDVMKYIPKHSYVIGGGGLETNAVNIYKPDGTVVLDTINGTKMNGDILEVGQEYVIEFDATVGPYHNGLLLAGVDNSVLSYLTWSDSMYTERENENADTTDMFYEIKYNNSYKLYPDYAGIHRFDWSYTGGYWGESTYGWYLNSTPAKNTNGVYDTREEGFWTIEPNYCASLYGQHFIGSGKSTRSQTEAGYKYVRFNIKYDKFNTIGTGLIDGVEEYGKILKREQFNLYAILHMSDEYIFFNSDEGADYTARAYSMVTDDKKEIAEDVTVYDADTKEVVLNGTNGPLLQANKKYVIEVDTTGTKNGAVLMSGFENALLSNAVWSNEKLGKTDATEIQDTFCSVKLDTANHHLAKDEPMFHRIWKSGDGYTGNYRDCVAVDGVVDTSVAANRSDDFMRCMEFARKCWFASKKTTGETQKKYFRFTVEYRAFPIIEAGASVTDPESPYYGMLAGTYFNSFIYSPAGGRYLYLTAYNPE